MSAPLLLASTVALASCGGGRSTVNGPTPVESPTWDLATRGVPTFVTTQYIDLARIGRISRYRSGIGHSYTDGTESCRSMKHYFEPRGTDWSTVQLIAPVSGLVRFIAAAGDDVKLTIESSEYPAFSFEIFHVRLTAPLGVGGQVTAGQLLGTHIGTHTYSDVAVTVRTPQGQRLVSWFQTLTDGAWQAYAARGVATRDAFIISAADRNADPIPCVGEAQFAFPGTIPNWVTLN